jgi:hypothetical protein
MDQKWKDSMNVAAANPPGFEPNQEATGSQESEQTGYRRTEEAC